MKAAEKKMRMQRIRKRRRLSFRGRRRIRRRMTEVGVEKMDVGDEDVENDEK